MLVRGNTELKFRLRDSFDWLLRVHHKAWITLKNCARYNGSQITTLRCLPCQALQHRTSSSSLTRAVFEMWAQDEEDRHLALAIVNGGSLDPRTQLSDFKASAMDRCRQSLEGTPSHFQRVAGWVVSVRAPGGRQWNWRSRVPKILFIVCSLYILKSYADITFVIRNTNLKK